MEPVAPCGGCVAGMMIIVGECLPVILQMWLLFDDSQICVTLLRPLMIQRFCVSRRASDLYFYNFTELQLAQVCKHKFSLS